ncbi:hypothetical protein GCM10007872_31530 [Gluconobacter sphaericus NBRC 12467]|uniref:Uncharacterized protein n=1 Tax=Gluconobacter sphaericus NBRC 12467 TaxID=1307951 RepID=A0AA37WB38_9PROT|nr:hypothetical protein AA12467_0223 [Gluconobacter sphaericus NBRC 12467]GEB43919.1 hypothetical protein GSP01_27010 [Gluconobacter sphaericus NBRC 12467]GLQ86240.1 hypothetical protein GCM10007872_31530 [Gluconobacter sphaericus NBRC 12467]
MFDPCRDNAFAELVLFYRFNGCDRSACHPFNGRDTRPDSLTIHEDRAGPALREAATILRTRHGKVITQSPQQGSFWLDLKLMRYAVYGEIHRLDFHSQEQTF